MEMINLVPVEGVVQSIRPLDGQCCQQRLSIQSSNGITTFILSPQTHIMNDILLRPGMLVTAFYDADVPVPLIFPPQFQAVFVARRQTGETITAGYFDKELLNQEHTLKLNIAPQTEIRTSNGQRFTCPVSDRLLMVYYTFTTRSIPPQTTPKKIIVIC